MATDERRARADGPNYRVVTIPRFPGMTLPDAAELGMQRLRDEGCRAVLFDRGSVSDADWYAPPDGEWHLGYSCIPPSSQA